MRVTRVINLGNEPRTLVFVARSWKQTHGTALPTQHFIIFNHDSKVELIEKNYYQIINKNVGRHLMLEFF